MRRACIAWSLTVPLLLVLASPSLAHPLGNFTSNTYAGLRLGLERVEVDYVLDLAEIPALRVIQRLDLDGDGLVSDGEGSAYRQEECESLAAGLELTVSGRSVRLAVERPSLAFLPGQAGLETMRLECLLSAAADLSSRESTVRFVDSNLAGVTGWREVTATGDGATLLSSSVPAASLSDRLRAYPQERLAAPLDVKSAELTVGADAGDGPEALFPAVVPGPVGRGLDRFNTAFTDLVTAPDLSIALAALGALLAFGLGGLHAAAPGHGKTVMAAVLVSGEGSLGQAFSLGLTVAVTHTLGVLALGALFTLSEVLSPARLYTWLGVMSGLLFASVGATLLLAALRRRPHHDHEHDHPAHEGRVRWRSLVLPGLAGGLLPSPSALLVLLGGIALQRAWYGLALVSVYGAGMACVLVGTGWLLARARDRMRVRFTTGRSAALFAALPIVTSSLVIAAGLLISLRAALAAT